MVKEVDRIKSVVASNAVTASREPDLYDGQPDMPSQFLEVLRSDEACIEFNRDLRDFFEAVFAGIKGPFTYDMQMFWIFGPSPALVALLG